MKNGTIQEKVEELIRKINEKAGIVNLIITKGSIDLEFLKAFSNIAIEDKSIDYHELQGIETLPPEFEQFSFAKKVNNPYR